MKGAADGAEAEGAAEGAEAGFDPAAAQRSFESVEEWLDSLSDEEIVALRVDLQRVAAIGLTIALRDSAPERRGAFERFARDGYYDITNLDRLLALAEGAWHVRRQQQRLARSSSGAALPEDDVRAAYELRGRMMLVLDYHLGDRRDIAQDLAHLREGAGHQDLANDLQTLRELYLRDDVKPVIERDVKNYRATDPDDAHRLARAIMLSLGVSKEDEAKRLTRLAQRVATLLVRAYEKHCLRGKFLFHEVEDVEATYPSLYAAARSPRRKRRDGEPGGGGAGPGGGGAGPGGGGAGPDGGGEVPVAGV
ncbi:MAG TPA: hypothetical protein VFS43_17155 [Polyangiaceae bacterium]|nr:hypothetical protein [Polyangiaceae bacterium]